MNARSYRLDLKMSPLDFPAITGLGDSSLNWHSEPHLNDDKVRLNIAKQYVLTDLDTNKEYVVLEAKCVYEIPINVIKCREDVYDVYRDATLTLNEAYQFVCTQMPTLHKIVFPTPPIETYKGEIDRVFALLNSRN